jgi:hypothetical protein
LIEFNGNDSVQFSISNGFIYDLPSQKILCEQFWKRNFFISSAIFTLDWENLIFMRFSKNFLKGRVVHFFDDGS